MRWCGRSGTPAAGTALHPADSCSLAGRLPGPHRALARSLAPRGRRAGGMGQRGRGSGSAFPARGPRAPSAPRCPSPGSAQYPRGRRRLFSLNSRQGRRRGLRGRREGEEVGLGQCENAEGRPGETRLGPRRGAPGAQRGRGRGVERREGSGARGMPRRRAR